MMTMIYSAVLENEEQPVRIQQATVSRGETPPVPTNTVFLLPLRTAHATGPRTEYCTAKSVIFITEVVVVVGVVVVDMVVIVVGANRDCEGVEHYQHQHYTVNIDMNGQPKAFGTKHASLTQTPTDRPTCMLVGYRLDRMYSN